MTLAFIVFMGEALIMWEPTSHWDRKRQKIFHGGLLILSLFCMIGGLVAVFTFHNNKNIPNLYSLHSWLGIGTVSVAFCQWITGFMYFFLDIFTPQARTKSMYFHRYVGLAVFASGVSTACLGWLEKLMFLQRAAQEPLGVWHEQSLLMNICGIFFFVTGLAVMLHIYARHEQARNNVLPK
eukprot:TRINITY_DN11745_c0_g2_i33.p1 TRINITY_DN11745_c0_g2~~TRINITY_DN11745_c0_g2_i33.p1  ORF type:complete len:181 (-),score=31.01 TRINITY_DN11745_c0_g2_i33:230-772(-)